MKPRCQLVLVVDTQAHAEQIRQAIESRLAGKDIFDQVAPRVELVEGDVLLFADVRFNARAHRDDLWTWIQQRIQAVPDMGEWVISASVERHDCTHDDPFPSDCRTSAFEVWRKPRRRLISGASPPLAGVAARRASPSRPRPRQHPRPWNSPRSSSS